MNPDSAASPIESPFAATEAKRGAIRDVRGGWRVAASFPDAPARLRAARAKAGLADLARWGRLKVTGNDRATLLQRISTNDLRPLASGRFAPTVFVTPKGRILDRAIVLDRGESLLLLTGPQGRGRLQEWIRKYTLASDVRVTDVTLETAAFALTGPSAGETLKALTGFGIGGLEAGRFLGIAIEDVDAIVAPFDQLPGAWIVIAERPGIAGIYAGAAEAVEAAGGALLGEDETEVLRVEAAIPWEGKELVEDWNPWEAGLEGSISLSKGCYTGQEVIARLNTYDKVQRRIVRLRFATGTPPAAPSPIFTARGEDLLEVGALTSAVQSEPAGGVIGLGIVRLAYQEPGTELLVGDARIAATILPND